MSARENLVAAYGSWEQWSQREGQAIRDGNWAQVGECQRTKQGLQARIIGFTEAARTEVAASGLPSPDCDPELRQLINRLILLETRNTQLVAERRRVAESHQAGLENAVRNLRRVKHSYVPPSLVAWQSYS